MQTNLFVQIMQTSIRATESTSKGHRRLDNFTINRPPLNWVVTLLQNSPSLPSPCALLRLKFAWFAREIGLHLIYIFKRPNWGAIFASPLSHVYIYYQPSDLYPTSDIMPAQVPSGAFYSGLEDS